MTRNAIQRVMIGKTKRTIDRFNMLEKGDTILVAFSAGPDSSALLCLLSELKQQYDISLCACHVNHMLRAEESLEDEKTAKKICRRMNVPCKVTRRNIKKLKRKGESLEEAARRIR